MDKELHLTDLIDVKTLQEIQDAFSKMAHVAALTTDADGIPVTNGSNFQDFCNKYTRTTEKGCHLCEQCDKYGATLAYNQGKAMIYHCHAGLVDFSAPIIVNNKIIGSFIGGQILTEPANEEAIRSMAVEIGVDPDQYIEAVRKVPIVQHSDVATAADFLYVIANTISNITYNRYQTIQASAEIERTANMKSDFLANMSHEIRTPMNAVIGMTELALREDLPDTARKYINEIKTASKSLLTIINDILDFSKIDSGKMDIIEDEYEPLSIINDITNIIITRLKDEQIELIIDVDPTLPRVLSGDYNRIKQILLNIANNAVKFTNEGRVKISLTYTPKSKDEIILLGAVEDTGIGIKKENLQKIFNSFYQLNSKRNRSIEGTGLGLAITKQLLTLMNGEIYVDSEYGKGSTFSFSIPQKIVDNRPSICANCDADTRVAGLFFSDYARQQFKTSVSKFKIKYEELYEEKDLDKLDLMNVDYLFVELPHNRDNILDFAKAHPDIQIVFIASYTSEIPAELSNVKVIKKPVYSLNIAQILNNESPNIIQKQETDYLDFTAPDANILIVDDNPINNTITEGLLQPLNMHIDTATSGREAIDLISSNTYDIIYMDHMMPDMDGVETTHIIRRLHPEYDRIPIIALTANAVNGTRDMFIKEGMNDFVPKPIEIRALINSVRKWLPEDKIIKNTSTGENTCKCSLNKEETIHPIGDIDINKAINMIGNVKLYKSILKEYYKAIDKRSDTIEQLFKDNDLNRFTIEVHSLKSSSRQIGALELADMAERLEAAGKNNDVDYISKNTAAMLSKYRSYIEVLQPEFEDLASKTTYTNTPIITKEQLSEFFEEFRAAIDNLDSDTCEEILDKMKHFKHVKPYDAYLSYLSDAIDMIDLPKCSIIIDAWEKDINKW